MWLEQTCQSAVRAGWAGCPGGDALGVLREAVVRAGRWARCAIAAQARTELLRSFPVLPPLPCFYWPGWMLQRGNQMWDRDDLKGQVINIICLNLLILMGWCLRRWPQAGAKHDPLNPKWAVQRLPSLRALLLLQSAELDFVYVHVNAVRHQSTPTASSFNFLST